MNITDVLNLLRIILLGLVIILNLIYAIPILFLSYFHRRHKDIFTLNICLAVIGCCIYYITFFIILDYHLEQFLNDNICNWLTYTRIVFTSEVSFAFVVVFFNRFISMIYSSNSFFKSKKWMIICIICQWIIGFIVGLPSWLRNNPYCMIPPWISIYILIIIVIIPSCLVLIINLHIFIKFHSLFRRTYPLSNSTQTNINRLIRKRLSRRDIRLLLHTIFMFFMFIIGWSPIFILTAVDIHSEVPIFIYTLLIILVEVSFLCDIINLFLYNQTLRDYLKNEIFQLFSF